MQVLLLQAKKPLRYNAGQYVEFLLSAEEARPFSIANAPNDNFLEFHIRHFPDNAYMIKLIHQICHIKKLTLKGPYGTMRCHDQPAYPLIFIAAGTGLAPCKAMIEEALSHKNVPDIYLYWAARKHSDLYWHAELQKLAKQTRRFHYTPVLSAEGRVYEAALKQHPDFSHAHVYASGPAEMVFAVQKALSHQGLNPQYFYSDWLDLTSQNAGINIKK